MDHFSLSDNFDWMSDVTDFTLLVYQSSPDTYRAPWEGQMDAGYFCISVTLLIVLEYRSYVETVRSFEALPLSFVLAGQTVFRPELIFPTTLFSALLISCEL